jgi:hypothetical protein
MITDLESLFIEGNPWPPVSERERFARYKTAKLIRSNRYNDLWGDELRYLREDNKKELKVYLGLPWLALKKTSDILLGTPPKIGFPQDNAGKPDPNQSDLDILVELNNFRQILKEVLFDMDPLGDGIFKVYKDDEGLVEIQANSPSNWIPIVKPGAIRDIQYHILFHIFKKLIKKQKKCYLKVEIHSLTEIGHRIYEITHSDITKTCIIGKLQDLADFQDEYPGLKDVEDNPIKKFLVITCHNIRTSDDLYGRGSIEGDLEGILKATIQRYSQVSRILDKHGDLNMVVPNGFTEKNIITGKQQFRGGGRIFQYNHDPGTTAPDIYYLTPDFAGLDKAETEIKRFKEDLHNLLEFPPAAMATEGGLADKSGTAWRLSLTPLLEKAARLREELDWSARQCLTVALALMGIDSTGLSISWSDGLPTIPLEESQGFSQLANTPAFMGEVGLIWLLKNKLGISEEVAQSIAQDSSRGGGLGGMI